jgi:hypothetical protein
MRFATRDLQGSPSAQEIVLGIRQVPSTATTCSPPLAVDHYIGEHQVNHALLNCTGFIGALLAMLQFGMEEAAFMVSAFSIP